MTRWNGAPTTDMFRGTLAVAALATALAHGDGVSRMIAAIGSAAEQAERRIWIVRLHAVLQERARVMERAEAWYWDEHRPVR